MASVQFEHVTKVYPGGVCALSDCTLDVADGELLVLVGPSGCGKSTLLRLLAGLEDVTAGTIRIGGRVVNGLSPQERNVAMVFQDYALYPHMTVRENLEFPLRMRGLSRRERRERAERIAVLLEIVDLLDRLPKQLSGGERQRVAMGRALVREPSAFLLDEPLSNLDAQLRSQVRVEIAELQRRGKTTTIYVTHDQSEAMTLGRRVAVLHQGRLQQVGTPRELYERPANVFVAGFIGNPPMNLFPVRVTSGPGDCLTATFGNRQLLFHVRGAREWVEATGEWTAGVRPESIRLARPETADSPIAVAVLESECLGHETLVHARVTEAGPIASSRLIVRLPGMHEFSCGQPLFLDIPPEAVHLFRPDGVRCHDVS